MRIKNYAKQAHKIERLELLVKRLRQAKRNWEKCAERLDQDAKLLRRSLMRKSHSLQREMERNGVLMKENLRLNDLCQDR